MAESILSKEKRCYICGTTQNLHLHHVFRGPFRKKSEQYGLTCFLCFTHHTGNHGVHNTHEGQLYWRKLKAECQEAFERIHGHEKFMKEFKRNYKNG